MFAIQERDVPEQLVITEQRHVTADALPGWIEAAMGRLLRAAAPHGGPVAPPFVVYHGEVNEDSDGPVEVCIPVGVSAATADLPTRREPARHEAYARITKAQVAYPQILAAYDAVSAWAEREGRGIAAAPREVYFADFGAAAPTDPVCDVALPVLVVGRES